MIGMPEYLPEKCFRSLSEDGVDIYKYLAEPTPFLIHINTCIKERINNCKDLFPEWLNWNYISELFIMPGGTTEEGTKKAAEYYYANFYFYPYQQYMNWPAENCGNILYNDKIFVSRLYEWHNDNIVNYNLVSDVRQEVKSNIYTFIEQNEKTVFIVDCENSDPYDLCAAIRGLDADQLEKVHKLILFNDEHAASGWNMLSQFIDIPTEHIMIERVKEDKSLTDVRVTARACKEFYQNSVDSFVIVASDSDYWGLIEELPDAKFMVMVEHEKCSRMLKSKLIDNGIFYCYIDSFYAAGGKELRQAALQSEIKKSVEKELNLSLDKLLNGALMRTRVQMDDEEKQRFIEQYIKNKVKLIYNESGNLSLEYKL